MYKRQVFGGRDSNSLSICGKWKTDLVDDIPQACHLVKSKVMDLPKKAVPSMIGLRYHAMVVLTSDCCLIHGGRHFKAISGKDVNSGFYVCVRDVGRKDEDQCWYQLSSKKVARFGHAMVLIDSELYLVGGFSSDSENIAANIQKVSLSDE